jgi:hypothetical protein
MKRVVLGIALIACLPVFPQNQPTTAPPPTVKATLQGEVFPQDQPAAAPPHSFLLYRLRTGGWRVTTREDGRELAAIAKNIDGKLAGRPEVVRFTGDVEITIDGMKLLADQLDYHWVTGEIEPLGNVHLTPVAPSNP